GDPVPALLATPATPACPAGWVALDASSPAQPMANHAPNTTAHALGSRIRQRLTRELEDPQGVIRAHRAV
ncbi:MAG TPA: hypothetical protein VJR89_22765, partial [Polyangiales bacterium]|nr:hypothetical protein [Polyangiales bacterium]